jgi:hypothetical protein
MNIHVPDEIRKKWCNYEFVGKPFKLGDGKTYIRAFSETFNATHYYCFEDDWFWHERPIIKIPITQVDKPKTYGMIG